MKIADLQQHRIVKLARLTMQEWFADNTPRHAAALAYYTIFALSPLLTIVFTIAAAVYGYDVAESNMAVLIQRYINNPGVAELFQTVLINSRTASSNSLVPIVSVGALIYGATNVFSELQNALNVIWDAPVKQNVQIRDLFLHRLFAILMVFLGGLVLFAFLIFSTIISAINQWADMHLHVTVYSEWVVFLSLFGVSTVVFGLIYKFVPDVNVGWRDVFIGAVTTGLLFTTARAAINLYFRYTSISSIFGATGSLVALLVWIYYSALIFFLGAEFTQVYSRTYGSRWREQMLLDEVDVEEKSPTVETPEGVIVKEAPAAAQPQMPSAVKDEIWHEAEIYSTPADGGEDVAAPAESGADAEQEAPPTARTAAVRKQIRRGVQGAKKGARALRTLPGTITSPIGDIAIGIAVVGVISVAGLLWEPWRRKTEEER